MSEEPNANLDPLFRVRDPNAVAESAARLLARFPEVEEEEKEATERDRLQRQDEEQEEFYRGRIPRGANQDGQISFRHLPVEEQCRIYNANGDMSAHGCYMFHQSLLDHDRSISAIGDAEEAVEAFRASISTGRGGRGGRGW